MTAKKTLEWSAETRSEDGTASAWRGRALDGALYYDVVRENPAMGVSWYRNGVPMGDADSLHQGMSACQLDWDRTAAFIFRKPRQPLAPPTDEGADIVDRLNRSLCNEEVLTRWDAVRAMLLDGVKGSLPRDVFESMLDGFDEERSEAALEIARLRRALATARAEALEEAAALAEETAAWRVVPAREFENVDDFGEAYIQSVPETRSKRVLGGDRIAKLIREHAGNAPRKD